MTKSSISNLPFTLFLFCTSLRVLRQGISSSISLSLMIVDLEVVTREFLSLANLSGAQTLCVYELVEIVVVGNYKYLMTEILYVVSPGLESLNNS